MRNARRRRLFFLPTLPYSTQGQSDDSPLQRRIFLPLPLDSNILKGFHSTWPRNSNVPQPPACLCCLSCPAPVASYTITFNCFLFLLLLFLFFTEVDLPTTGYRHPCPSKTALCRPRRAAEQSSPWRISRKAPRAGQNRRLFRRLSISSHPRPRARKSPCRNRLACPYRTRLPVPESHHRVRHRRLFGGRRRLSRRRFRCPRSRSRKRGKAGPLRGPSRRITTRGPR